MAPATIKLRDPPEEVRQKLGLSKQQFDNFKTYALNVHREYCAGHPHSSWANQETVWSAIPEFEKQQVIQMLKTMCIDRRLFPPGFDRTIFESGCEQRLHQCRRTWQQTGRTRGRGARAGTEDDDPREGPSR
ncbi:hypothetical protein RBB50_005833 [Rhinocladiella similis]